MIPSPQFIINTKSPEKNHLSAKHSDQHLRLLFITITIESPSNHHQITIESPSNHHQITVKSPSNHHPITVKSPSNHHPITGKSSPEFFSPASGSAMALGVQVQCSSGSIEVWLQRMRVWVFLGWKTRWFWCFFLTGKVWKLSFNGFCSIRWKLTNSRSNMEN